MKIVKVPEEDVEYDHIHVGDWVYKKGEYFKLPCGSYLVGRKSEIDKNINTLLRKMKRKELWNKIRATIKKARIKNDS